MKRTLAGVLIGAVIVAVLGSVFWWRGVLHLGTMAMDSDAEMAMPGGEMAGMPMPAAADEHAGHDVAAAPVAAAPAGEMPADAVMITPERQQLIGVRTAPVMAEDVVRTIRTVGNVEYDETKVAHIHTRVTGWIERLLVDFTGKLVQKGQPLLEIYSPQLVSTQEEYLLALRGQESLGASAYPEVASTSRSLLEATRRRLLLWDITPEQIAELEARREPRTSLTLYSPIDGHVIHKNAYEGQHVGPDSQLFTIADLSEVWLMADIYESELQFVRLGQRATATLSYEPDRVFRGVVDYIYPYLAGDARTAKVRVALPNPDGILKPDMFANVELTVRQGRSLTVPEDAVIDTGERQVVFLVLEGGHFLPREVLAGNRFDGKLQILEGLVEGDVVVSGAAFLVDSESKLRSSLRGMSAHQH